MQNFSKRGGHDCSHRSASQREDRQGDYKSRGQPVPRNQPFIEEDWDTPAGDTSQSALSISVGAPHIASLQPNSDAEDSRRPSRTMVYHNRIRQRGNRGGAGYSDDSRGYHQEIYFNNDGDGCSYQRGGFNDRRGAQNYSNRGNFNSARSDSSNQRGHSSNQRTSNNQRGGFNNERTSYRYQREDYNNQRSGYNNEKGGYNNDRSDYNNERGGYNNKRGGFNNQRSDYMKQGGACDSQNEGGNPRSGSSSWRKEKTDKEQESQTMAWGGGRKTEEKKKSSHYLEVSEDDEVNKGDIDFVKLNKECEEFRRQELLKLPKIAKATYVEDIAVQSLSLDETALIRKALNNIEVSYVNEDPACNVLAIPNPVTTFEQCFQLYPKIMNKLEQQDFASPTPIQCQLWPCLMTGQDVVGIAQTGSGKTLGFLLPALVHIEAQSTPLEKRRSPTVLVMVPTRELAQQIHREVLKYNYDGIRSVLLYGGVSRDDQIAELENPCEIVIACPGRLNDIVQAGHLDLKEVSFLVLDEADEMLNQGFEPQINKALVYVRGDRQTCLTSATWPESVRRMAKNYTTNPVLVVVGTLSLNAVKSVTQTIVFMEESEKYDWVLNLILEKLKDPVRKMIVFVSKRARADHLSSELCLKGVNCSAMHGKLSQSDREQAIADLQSGDCRVLIASDVAARGIDISDLTDIINYDFPQTVEQYVHRIGRTGRAGRTGEATTVMGRDWSHAKQLMEVLEGAGQEVPDELKSMARRYQNRVEREAREEAEGGGRGRSGGGGFRGGRGRRGRY